MFESTAEMVFRCEMPRLELPRARLRIPGFPSQPLTRKRGQHGYGTAGSGNQKFLTLDRGQNADQVWQAQERSKVLRKVLEHKR